MYVAMNRFRVALGSEDAFETLWRNRDSHLEQTDGFVEFAMLRGMTGADHTLYISTSRWQSEQAFRDWMKSDNFRRAHKDVGSAKEMYLGPPDFEGFDMLEGM